MEHALITGGCGFLGSWIVRLLAEEGVRVRVFAVPGESRDNLEGVREVDIVEGDVRSVADCKRAVDGVDTVFHAAAIYLDWAPDPTLMYDVNLRGTFHVLEAARRAGVQRVVYTASIASLGRPEPGQLADETTAYEAWEVDFPYSRSKFFSRELAEYFSEWGLDVRVVCPGVVLGPRDIRPTPSGKLVLNAVRGGPAVSVEGGTSYVDVRDAARVHILAGKKGKPGARYLATAHNMTTEDLMRAVDEVIRRERRYLKVPVVVARAMSIGVEAAAQALGKTPPLSRDFLEYSLKPGFYSNRRATTELGATFRPIDETIRDAIEYFRSRKMV
jgi:dihydroflavonol-4-reductase